MLNILWRYGKSKAQRQRRIEMGGMRIVMVYGWLLLLSQVALATPPLYPGMGSGHKDDVAPVHHRTAAEASSLQVEEQERLLAPGDYGIGNIVYTTGTVSIIALMVNFKDVKFSKDKDIAYFNGIMDRVVTYYRDNSYGKLNITYAIATTSVGTSMSYYGKTDNASVLVNDTITAANGKVNFSNYAALMIIHAGQGQESDIKNENLFYSQFVRNPCIGVRGVCIVPEHEGIDASPFGIFCHEFGHQLGLPDLYDTVGDDSAGIGEWGLMASGAWNGYPRGDSPANFDAWCRMQMEWIMPVEVKGSLIHVEIGINTIYKLQNTTMNTKEYFLVENRQEAYLPGKGVLIYHIDDDKDTGNANQDNSQAWYPGKDPQYHYRVAVEQADRKFDLEHNYRGDAGDPYPGSSVNRYFDDWSIPNSRTYQGSSTYISVKNISNSAATMACDLSVVSLNINLTSPGNNDILYTGTPTFAWTSIEGVGTYTLLVGTRTFTVATTTKGTILYRPVLSFEENSSYTWNVTAVTGNGTYTSDTWHFWIDAIASPPSSFALLFPINGQTISQAAPTFKWQASTDPDPKDTVKYVLWYSRDSGTKTNSGTLTGNSWTPQNLCDGTYTWNVQAVDTTGNAVWSGTNTFTIQTVKAYPNPLILGIKDEITIEGIPTTGMVNIKIYNIVGEIVRDESVSAPDGRWKWNVRNNDNEQVASGIYIYLITNGKDKAVGKMAVIR